MPERAPRRGEEAGGYPTAVLRARLDEGLARLGGPAAGLDPAARARLVRLVELLARWNRVHNLTAVRDAREMIGRHLLDSLALLPWLDGRDGVGGRVDGDGAGRPSRGAHESDVFDLLDIGSGGGLPVLPLAIARPGMRGLSVEANGKKAAFQSQAVIELGLGPGAARPGPGGVEVRHARIESVATRARVVVSRAFAAPSDFLAAAAPRCSPGGTALIMLGRAERLPEPLPAPFSLIALHPLEVPFESGSRHVAVCRAADETAANGEDTDLAVAEAFGPDEDTAESR